MPGAACRVYAPVGSHRDLLAYLVRRLLENGANSSFVAAAADPSVPIEDILKRPQAWIGDAAHARHPHIPLPRDLYRPARRQFDGCRVRRPRGADGARWKRCRRARCRDNRGRAAPRRSGDGHDRRQRRALPRWNATPVERRADVARTRGRIAGGRAAALIALLQIRRRQDLDDALAEVREAVDYLPLLRRRGARLARAAARCRGRPARRNELRYRGRGVFVCISPWNFPLAIFLGQVAAALAAGNAVVAKPAEQTPLMAAEAVRLLHRGRRAGERAASRAGRRQGRRGAGRRRAGRRRGLHRLDRGRPRHQPRARRQGRPDRAADRRDRRHQRHDRGRHRAARAGDRRRGHVGVPLGRPALLGAAAAVRAGGRGRPHDRDDRGRRAASCASAIRAIRRPTSGR